MSSRADSLEAAARDAIAQRQLDQALEWLDVAAQHRVATQGAQHPGLIWTLSLMIDARLWRHSLEDARAAAKLGERRLTLRRRVLHNAPCEMARTLRELAALYRFEEDEFDILRAAALREEAETLWPQDE